MTRIRHQFRRYGFTFVELMLGMVVTALVLSALAVFTFGVSDNWLQSDSSQSAFLRETMALERLSRIIRPAQEIEPSPTVGSLDTSTPSAECMIWTDSNGDGAIQYYEMAVLQYLPDSQTLVEWTIPPAANNAGQTYVPTVDAPLMSDSIFTSLPNVTCTTVADNVMGCQFYSIPGSASAPMQRPSMEAVLKIGGAGSSVPPQVVYSTIALRAPLLNTQ